jgi:hypothetical protein
MTGQIAVPIAMFLCITYVIKLLIDARMRILLLRASGSDEALHALLRGEEQQRRHASLRAGISLLALGLGFGLIHLLGWREITPGAIALLSATLGLGHLCYYALTRRHS